MSTSKTKSITVRNFKAVKELEMNFDGCTALITGGNKRGKSSILRGIADRVRGQYPDLQVKQGEKEGEGELTLTTGERFKWEFDVDGKDKLTFYTREGIKTAVTKEIAKRFFPPLFDIDKFLNEEPAKQSKMLQKILGVDCTLIDTRYKQAYDERTEKNKELSTAKAKINGTPVPEKAEKVDVSAKMLTIREIEARNKPLKEAWDKKVEIEKERVRLYNLAQDDKGKAIEAFTTKKPELQGQINKWNEEIKALEKKIEANYEEITKGHDLPLPDKYIIANEVEVPAYESIEALTKEVENATETNAKADKHEQYMKDKQAIETAKKAHEVKDGEVKAIGIERSELLAKAKLPKGIEITPDGITVDGFPLDKNQISTSALYIAAIKLASLGLGDVRTLHFDASSLDNPSLAEVEKWAAENDLQLLIERPAPDGGDIAYEIVEG